MPFLAGDRLGPYEVISLLGRGGMGEVYRARDTTLKREVALKVLPAAFARDPERVARFQREAEVLASLNHPNIAHIYGTAEQDGVRALAMELVEGDSPKGPLGFDEAWKIATQIAAALEYAHDQGVVHRDLKPANIKVTPDGVVKLLDFGLAKAFSAQTAEPTDDPENSPTLTMGATQAGVILGTAAYMAPEQAKGKKIDRRADIWAFGVVVWELLAGERLFQGEDAGDTLAHVLTQHPDLERVPMEARRLIQECLMKDPRQRLRDIGDARRLVVEQSTGAGSPQAANLPHGNHRLPWVVAAVMTVAAVALGVVHFRETPPPMQTLRYSVALPEGAALDSFAVSPDGRFVAIAAAVNGKRQLWLRPLNALQAQAMPGTDEAEQPFWSPDSRYIGFGAQGKLKKIAASGGPPQSLCDAGGFRGGSWNREDIILFSSQGGSAGIQRVPAAGGVPTQVIKTNGGVGFRYPAFLPDGRRFLYVLQGEKSGIYAGSLDAKENQRILADVSSAAFAPLASARGVSGSRSGHLLFVRQNTLMALPFDAGTAQASGDVFPVAEGLGFHNRAELAPMTVSENGVLLFWNSGSGTNQIVWYDRAGKFLGPASAPGDGYTDEQPSISPDGKTMAFSRQHGSTSDIWLRDLVRATDRRLTSDVSSNAAPVWSPKADRIVFNSNRGDHPFSPYQKPVSGSGQDEQLLSGPNVRIATQWSRDGRFILYFEVDPKTKRDLWVLPLDDRAQASTPGVRKPILFLQTAFNELQGQLSPDSRWMAYTSDESGEREVYVRPFPAAEGVWRISIAGGNQPRWRGDGKELFYIAADGKMTAVPVNVSAEPKPSFEPGTPAPLFDTHLQDPTTNTFEYDVTADGKRFLVNSVVSASSSTTLTVVVNWNASVKN